MGNCYCFGNLPYQHKTTALTASATAVNMTVTNNTNVSELTPFELLLTVNPGTVVTGAPLPYTITINGTAVNLLNRFGLPIYTSRLRTRKVYVGSYVVPTTGDPYVILLDTPTCPQFAKP